MQLDIGQNSAHMTGLNSAITMDENHIFIVSILVHGDGSHVYN